MTIRLPENMTANDLYLALIAGANWAETNDMPALANERREQALAITEEDAEPTGCVCHCEQRDPDEIAVYLQADELVATLWAIGRITFGDLTDAINVRHVHGAYTEVEAVALDRLSNF